MAAEDDGPLPAEGGAPDDGLTPEFTAPEYDKDSRKRRSSRSRQQHGPRRPSISSGSRRASSASHRADGQLTQGGDLAQQRDAVGEAVAPALDEAVGVEQDDPGRSASTCSVRSRSRPHQAPAAPRQIEQRPLAGDLRWPSAAA